MANEYEMIITGTTIDHLGIKLYDRVSAVVGELIANSYDADAEEVIISVPLGNYLANKSKDNNNIIISDLGLKIEIEDNGHGMTPQEVKDYYLLVGQDRRVQGLGPESRDKARPVMGRKGIGKLAPFGICKTIEVITSGGMKTANGYKTAHFILELDEIKNLRTGNYQPKVGKQDHTFNEKSGTKIILKDFDYKLVPNSEVFHRQIAARFGIERDDWKILVINSNDENESNEGFLVGELETPIMEGTRKEFHEEIIIEEDEDGELIQNGTINGWIAYARESYKDDVMAGVRIYARGKIVAQTRDFNLPSGFTGEHKLRSYLIGAINADWLDNDSEDDMIRSDRQDILWDTERGRALQKWGQLRAKELAASSEVSVRRKVWEEFLEISDIEDTVSEKFKNTSMRKEVLSVAKMLVSRSDRDSIQNQTVIDAITQQAFAIAPHQVLVTTLQKISESNLNPLEQILELFEQAGIAEKYSLGQVASERIDIIQKLEEAYQSDADEMVFQRIIQDAPWLINPQWTQLSANQTLKTFKQSFAAWHLKRYGVEIVLNDIVDHQTKRPDFVLLDFKNNLEVVEIKKSGHNILDEEFDRFFNYIDALNSFIKENPTTYTGNSKVHLILVSDGVNLTDPQKIRLYDELVANGEVEQRTWTEFINTAKTVHEDFLNALDNREIE